MAVKKYYTTSELATEFDVTRETIYNWSRKPDFPKPLQAKRSTANRRKEQAIYDLEQVREWHASRKKAKEERKEARKNPGESPHTEMTRIKTERLRIQLAKDQGEVISLGQIAGFIEELIAGVRFELSRIPENIETELPTGVSDDLRGKIRDVAIRAVRQAEAELERGRYWKARIERQSI